MKYRQASLLGFACFVMVCCLMPGCTRQEYETGDGEFSYLRADFADLYTSSDAKAVSAMTDYGDSLLFSKPFSSRQIQKPDTTYRALFYYYNKVENGKVEPYAMKTVSVPTVRMTSKIKKEIKTDPVTLQSAWMSQNRRYVNLAIVLKTGVADDEDAAHVVGMVCDTVINNPDNGVKTMKLRFYHDQGEVPQYYSTTFYMSVAFDRLPVNPKEGDVLEILLNTYDGERQLEFTVPSL